MRKKVTLFLILALSVILTFSLVACNSGQVDKLPDEIGAGEVNQNNNNNGKITTYLKFSMPEAASSIFNGIDVAEFDVSKVLYSIVYTDDKTTTVVNGGNLTDAAIVKITDGTVDDNGKLHDWLPDFKKTVTDGEGQSKTVIDWKKGHYMVHVSVTLDNGKAADGSFALHLKQSYEKPEQIKLTFDLANADAHASFGEVQDGKRVIYVDKGITFASWDDFTDAFRMGCDGKALSSITYAGGTLSASVGFAGGFRIDSDMSFTATWTDNVIKAKFNLNRPADATLQYGMSDPVLVNAQGDSISNQTIVRGIGKVQSPLVDKFNVFNGYYFAGWYLDTDGNGVWSEQDTLWVFSQSVGSSDITLVARWTKRAYAFTLYTMGGVYPQNVQNSVISGKEIKSDSDVPSGYNLVSATSRFSLEDGAINRLVINGLAYGVDYSKYVVKVVAFDSANDDEAAANTRYFTFADLTAKLVKGNEEYVKYSGIYKDYQCTEPAKVDKVVADDEGRIDDIGYIKWVFNEPQKPADDATEAQKEAYRRLRLERLSNYYTEVVFKNSLSVKADGSIRIDRIEDESVSELTIPATLIVDGKELPISEISAKACMNLKALLKLDMSKASNLKIIGEQAFAHCPVLSEVSFPTNSAIKEMGRNIFYKSQFENEYKDNNDTDYFIVNDILYKYVGNGVNNLGEPITLIDLSEMTGIATIASGAFEGHGEIVSVVLPDGVTRINNGAFTNCVNLQTLEVSKTSALSYIGETAFEGCAKLLSVSSNVYQSNYEAIIIGKVYYKLLNKSAISATVPTNDTDTVFVNHIAPKAFDGCSALKVITIDYPDQILSIGKDAFNSTEWIKTDDEYTYKGFSVINGMLAVYYSTAVGNQEDLILPSNVKRITEGAFGTFANRIATVQFGNTIEKIDDYAFIQASSLVSLIFHKVSVDEDSLKMVGAPEISEFAFAEKDGKLRSTVRFFFRKEVIDFMEKHVDDSTVTDAATKSWLQLYRQYPSRFITEDIKDVWIAKDAITSTVLRTNKNWSAIDAIEAIYPDGIEGALVVTSNTEVVRYEKLDFAANSVGAVLITKDNYPELYEEGLNRYIITFEYDGSTKGCHNSATDAHVLIINVVDAIDSSETNAFYESANNIYESNGAIIDASGKTNSDAFWFEGFEGDKDGERVPTFYTSNRGITLRFGYRDVAGNVHYINVDGKNIEDFDTSEENNDGTAVVTVEFHGLGKYKFSLDYVVRESKFVSIEQNGAVAIPINGSPVTYFRRFTVNMIGEDGIAIEKTLSTQEFKVAQVDGVANASINTSTLGLHTITIKYIKKDAIGELQQDIIYSVVLEADANLFTYDIVDYEAKTARIVSCSARNAETVVLPTTYTKDGVVYTVTDIGSAKAQKGVFEGFTNLKAIYLARNIVNINANSFKGCTALENVYTAQRVDDEVSALNELNFEVVKTEENENETVKYVVVKNLEGVVYQGTLVIGAQYSADVDGRAIVYKVIGIGDLVVKAGTEVFLPDSVYRYGSMTYESQEEGVDGEKVEPYTYTSENNIKFKTVKYVSQSVEYIGNNAFEGCTALQDIDLTRATALSYIGANAFAGTALKSIDLSSNTSLKEINNGTFENCKNLETVVIGSSVTTLGSAAFKNCENLLMFVISGANGLKVIDATAFEGCNREGFIAPTVA